MASSNSSPAEKSCACTYIAFLAGIFSCYADSMLAESLLMANIFKCEQVNQMDVTPNGSHLLYKVTYLCFYMTITAITVIIS
jgi:hypothetical protein